MNPSISIRRATLGAALLVFSILVALPSALVAQPSGPLVDARLGEGELERDREKIPLVEGAATLRPDGTVWIVAKSRGDRFEFRGTWRQGEQEQRLMTIREAMGDVHADAHGWVMTKGGRLKQIEIVGRSNGGRRLRLHFLATADLPQRAPVWGGIDSTRPGEGELERGRGRQGIHRLRVVLEASGRAEIVLWGMDEIRLAGRWSEESGDSVRFEADAGLSGQPGSGSGTIELRDRQVERITLSGASGPHDYRLDFRAGEERRAEPPKPAPRPGRQEVSEQFGYNYDGGDYTSVYFDALAECKAACRRDERCLAYTYNTRTGICYLKDRVGRLERRQDTVSGVKGDGR